MRRVLLVVAVAAISMLALGGVAQAQDPPAPDQTLPPSFVPPAPPAEVVDVAGAEAFAEGYADDNANRFLRQRSRNVRVIDADAACLQNPAVATRFGCVFTLRALVIERRGGWWGHDSRRGDDHSKKNRRPRFRIRQYGCLGLLSVVGGPGVEPQGILRNVECRRVPRGDLVAPEPVA